MASGHERSAEEEEGDRLAARLAHAVVEHLVGRAVEQRELTAALTAEGGPAVVFLHGQAGIGKSTLLEGTLARLGRRAVLLHGRQLEPTPRGLLRGIAEQLQVPPERCRHPADLAPVLTAADVAVIAIDDYEHLGIVDGWIRNDLLPVLPTAVRTVLSGRNPPNLAWRTAPGWSRLVAEIVLAPLSEADADALLAGHGLTADQAERARRFGRGHPLALELAASAMQRQPDLDLRSGPPPEVVEELMEVILEGLAVEERTVTEAVSVLRRVTEPMLEAVLDGGGQPDRDRAAAVAEAWRSLRALPFTSVTRHGIELNPVVHDVLVGSLELRNPSRAVELRRRAAAVALGEVGPAPAWAPTADLLHLVQNPVVRSGFFPPAGMQHPVEVARPDDEEAILAVVERHDGSDGRALIARWWAAHPDAFSVARGADGEVRAISVVLELDRADQAQLADDPILRAVREHVGTHPVAPGERVLLNRRTMSMRHGDRLTADLAPMLIDIKRTYLELRPHLARVYVVGSDWGPAAPMMSGLGFQRTGHEAEIGGSHQYVAALDFGPGSVDAWLARLVATESAPSPDRGAGAVGRSSDPDAVGRLSPREREVLAALADGLTNRELADRLFISERTANRHLSNIFTKLGVHNRTAAARVAIEAGLAD